MNATMLSLLLALAVSVLGVVPLIIKRAFGTAAITAAVTALLWWWIFYASTPSLVWPFYGLIGMALFINLVISCVLLHLLDMDYRYNGEMNVAYLWILPAIIFALFLVRGCAGCDAFNAAEYTNLIGKVETRNWTTDVQPADTKHIRLVPRELAAWMADKQLGEAPGAIGSQYNVDKVHMTLQMIKNELWWVAPLDYNGFSVWTSVGYTPGYVMVHAEDPNHPVHLKTGHKFRYTPEAFFSEELKRHLWANGYESKGLTDYTFEVDETGKPWWSVTVFEPTIAYFGRKMTGVALVDPETGNIVHYSNDKIPNWIDRAIPQGFVTGYIHSWGTLSDGWVNSWWGKKNLRVPSQHHSMGIVYGTDGEPYWFTGITSANKNDQALVGLMYIHSRTGAVRLYQASGMNENAVVTAVENAVKYKNQQAAGPILYNFYGMMTWVVPLLGQSHTFQGVAMVRADTLQVVHGADQYETLREYQKVINQSGQQIAPDAAHQREEFTGKVLRVATDIRKGDTTYYLYLQGQPRLFIGASELSPKLPLTAAGDEVTVSFLATTEDVVPILKFDNKSIEIKKSDKQKDLDDAVKKRQSQETDKATDKDIRRKVEDMTPEELRDLVEKKEKK